MSYTPTYLKQWWKSRTNKAAVLGAVLTVVDANGGFFSDMFPPAFRPYLLMIWPLAMFYFRSVTSTSITGK